MLEFSLNLISFVLILNVSNAANPTYVKPLFTEHPQDTFVFRNSPLTLRCRADGHPTPSLTWYKDNDIVLSHRERPGTSTIIIKSGELSILSFDSHNEGKYYCKASNNAGSAVSSSALVKMAYSDNRLFGPESKIVSVGETAVLICRSSSGLLKPEVEWYKNKKKLQFDQRIQIMDVGDLRIDNVGLRDQGTYKCIVYNMPGERSSNEAVLTVRQKPQFEATPQNKQVRVGELARFMCRVAGDPKQTIIWKREDGIAMPVNRSKLLGDKSLEIHDIKSIDAGNYVCMANNSAGRVEAVARLDVISPPNFRITPEDQFVELNDTAAFECQAAGSPRPEVRWIHNNRSYLASDRSDSIYGTSNRIQVYSDGRLVIHPVRKTDEGLYECVASHYDGSIKSSACLRVREPSRIALPLIEIGPQNQTQVKGSVANFICKALVTRISRQAIRCGTEQMLDDYPKVIIEWFINGVSGPSPDNPRIVKLSLETLQINSLSLEDTGNYTCRARLGADSYYPRYTESTAHLSVSATPSHLPNLDKDVSLLLPDPPGGLRVDHKGDTWVAMRWYPGNSTANGYRVEYAEYAGFGGWQISVPYTTSVTERIDDLNPDTGYYFLVRGVNEFGFGRSSLLADVVYTNPMRSTGQKRNKIPAETMAKMLNEVIFSRILLEPTSYNTLIATWIVCAPKATLIQITGFRLKYHAVHLSRCLATLYPSEINAYETYPFSRSPSHIVGDARCPPANSPLYTQLYSSSDGSLSSVHAPCSLEGIRDLLEKDAMIDVASMQMIINSTEQLFEISQDISPDSPLVRTAIHNLHPFTCYEVSIEPMHSHEIGPLYGRASRSSTGLTYGSRPSAAPRVVSAQWLPFSAEANEPPQIELIWVPPHPQMLNGVVNGYSLRILNELAGFIRNISVSLEYG